MILAPAEKGVTLFRAYVPRWAFDPHSGAGAAKAGGRFNRKGTPALYLSSDLETAALEYQGASPFLPPLTMVSFTADLPELVDLSALGEGDWDPLWSDWDCDWLALILERVEPPSWMLGEMVQQAGIAGIKFPSTRRPGGTNVVLFTEMVRVNDILSVNDRGGRLPSSDASWPE